MPRPKKKAQAVADERKILDEWVPSDPSRPVYTALRTAFIEKICGVLHALNRDGI